MTVDRVAGARLLCQLRQRRGWSWSDLARAMRDSANHLAMTSLTDMQVASVRRAVARWESATDRTCPSERYQLVLAHLYARTPAGDLALGPGSDFSVLLDAFLHFGTPEQQVQQLVEQVTQVASRDSRTLTPLLSLDNAAGIAAVRKSVAAINGEIGTTPFVRLYLRLAPVVESCRQRMALNHINSSDELTLATETYALAARLAFETRDDDAAAALYADAASVAGRISDLSHRAAVRTSHAMVVLHATNDVDAARVVARSATLDAHRGSSYAIRARAHAVHAEICAREGRSTEAFAALSRAWTIADQLTVDDPHRGFAPHHLNGFDGLCALHAGEAHRAHNNLERSLNELSTSRDVVQRGIVSTDLALARLRLDDPVACVDLIHEAVDIAATTGGRVPAQRIRSVRRALRPWRAEQFLVELDDHIHDSLIGQ